MLNVHKMSPFDVSIVVGNDDLRRLMRPSPSDADVTPAAIDKPRLFAASKGDVEGTPRDPQPSDTRSYSSPLSPCPASYRPQPRPARPLQ